MNVFWFYNQTQQKLSNPPQIAPQKQSLRWIGSNWKIVMLLFEIICWSLLYCLHSSKPVPGIVHSVGWVMIPITRQGSSSITYCHYLCEVIWQSLRRSPPNILKWSFAYCDYILCLIFCRFYHRTTFFLQVIKLYWKYHNESCFKCPVQTGFAIAIADTVLLRDHPIGEIDSYASLFFISQVPLFLIQETVEPMKCLIMLHHEQIHIGYKSTL